MARRMPVLGQHDKVEIGHHGIDLRHDFIAAGYRQRAARAEIILRVDHDQGLHIHSPVQRLHRSTMLG